MSSWNSVARLLKDNEEDITSITTSSGSSSTVAGIGSLSGRYIMKGGELILGGVEGLIILRGLSQIAFTIRRNVLLVPMEFYSDLLELQRIGYYSKWIRRKAWDLILLLMEKRAIKQLVQAVSKWPLIEKQIWLRQLCIWRLSAWTINPARFVRVPDRLQIDPNGFVSTEPLARRASWNHSFGVILHSMIESQPDAVHSIFNIVEFTHMLVQPCTAFYPRRIKASVPHFFAHLSAEFGPEPPTYLTPWTFPQAAQNFLDFVDSGDADDPGKVVQHIVYKLCQTPPEPSILPPLNPARYKDVRAHPAFAYVWFAAHLAARNERALGSFIENNIIDILEYLWQGRKFYDDAVEALVHRMYQGVCCVFLACISGRGGYSNLVGYLRKAKTKWFLEIFPYFSVPDSVLDIHRQSIRDMDLPNLRNEFQDNLLDLLVSNHATPEERLKGWKVIVTEIWAGQEGWIKERLRELSNDAAVEILRGLVTWWMLPWGTLSWDLSVKQVAGSTEFMWMVEQTLYAKHFRLLVEQIYQENVTLVHESIDIGTLALIQTDIIAPGQLLLEHSISTFLMHLGDFESEIKLYDASSIPEFASSWVKYLAAVSTQQLFAVAQHLIACLRSYPPQSLENSIGSDWETNTIYCADLELHTLLTICVHLAFSTARMAEILLTSGIVEVLDSIPMGLSLAAESHATMDALLNLRLLLVGALGLHHPTSLKESLSESWSGDSTTKLWDSPWSIGPINVQLCLQTGKNSWFDLTKSIKDTVLELSAIPLGQAHVGGPIVEQLFVLPYGPSFDSHPWQRLISLFSDANFHSQETLLEAVNQIMLFCSTHPSDEWSELIKHLYPTFETESLPYWLDFMIKSYFGCHGVRNNPLALSKVAARTLAASHNKARSLQFQTAHPVDRFLWFLVLLSSRRAQGSSDLFVEGLSPLLEATLMGSFDQVQDNHFLLDDCEMASRRERCKVLLQRTETH